MSQKTENIPKVSFRLKLIILFLSCLLVGAAVLGVLWNYLSEYEKSNPTAVLEQYLQLVDKGDYKGAMAFAGVAEDGFFTVEEYQAYVDHSLGDSENPQIYEVSSKQPEHRIFEIKGEQDRRMRFTLQKRYGELKYGFASYTPQQAEIEKKSYQIYLPAEYSVAVNGVLLNQSYLKEEKLPVAEYAGLEDSTLAPFNRLYEVGGFIKEPVFSVPGVAENQYQMTRFNEKVTIQRIPEKKNQEIYGKLATQVAQIYAKFVSKDAKFEELQSHMLKETSFYAAIRNFSNTWYIPHDSVSFENLEVSNFVEYSSTHFSAEVSFDYKVYQKEKNVRRTYPTHYRLSFIKVGGGYKLVNLQSL